MEVTLFDGREHVKAEEIGNHRKSDFQVVVKEFGSVRACLLEIPEFSAQSGQFGQGRQGVFSHFPNFDALPQMRLCLFLSK
ncbi:hypothetical protein [Deinococcus hohokamensis]|uniref:hypothetical protein n=1 Tax=Deinococcus hohokamensis TaxID=309883 RepID=UPI0036D22FCD